MLLKKKEFMLCKAEENDPRKCLEYNKKLSFCANEFFHKVKENCSISFTNYWKCLDKSPGGQMSYRQ
jgi:NADH dehydrogenase (ubiquinone) 1 alpha subcomplex subunit 8